MKILLINNNPVVSRLTALSARKEDIEIDEIQEVTELSSDTYDIVFVDADSLSKDVRDVVSENIKTQKSVLFYTDGDEEEKNSFDISILKPFLPSEVSAVIRSIEESVEVSKLEESEENHFDILNDNKTSQKDELFHLGDLDDFEEKKKELVEVENVNFDEKLEEAFPLKINNLDDDLFETEPKIELNLEKTPEKEEVLTALSTSNDSKESLKSDKIEDELFTLNLEDEVVTLEDNLFTDDKKEETPLVVEELNLEELLVEEKIKDDEKIEDDKKVKDDEGEPLLALELDDDKLEVVLSEKEPKILDKTEIENIKGILTEDTDDEMSLDDLMTPPIHTPFESKETQPKEIDTKVSGSDEPIDSGVLAQTLSAMPVESLRKLLAGATVNIKIKFPKTSK
ncbi:MAG: Highly acidic protein [uncultured Sulfurovum sp.]|uniref:Highly acidic protein n=1 Tax=uncultured Sulfurovum sp. TaxID=269237 RepID=A0A6S6T6Q1_9BACT|nr:MAG: Highly acidic protein [uncultured Sulfurovum sp.]